MNSASPRMKRGMAGRGGPGRGRIRPSSGGPQQSQALEGLYSNDRLVNAVTSVLGCPAKVTGKNGKQFEGVFKTISPEATLVLGQARQVEQRQNGVVDPVVQKADTFEQFVMHRKDWRIVEFNNVNLEECYRRDSFKTDVAIVNSKRINGQTKKELERWAPSGSGDSMETPALEGHHTLEMNGWSADAMFDLNEKMYGVKSTYKEDMEEYTTKLEKSDTPEYREKERFAAQKAEEILKESPYERNTFDSGRSEEQLYSAVVRNKFVDRSSAANWRQPQSDRAPEREQRTPRISQDSSSSPVPAKKDPVSGQEIENSPSTTPQVKEKIEKPTTETPVESKSENKVEAFNEVVKAETKPDQNTSAPESPVTPANTPVTQVSTQVSTETPQDPTTTSEPSVDAAKTDREEIAEFKTFSKNFQLAEGKKKTRKKVSDEEEKTLNEAASKDEKDEEAQTSEEVKSESEPASTDKKPGLNPNAQEFRPRAKRNTPSPRSNSSASSSGAPSPYPNNSPFPTLSPYPHNGIYTRNGPRGRGMRTEFMDPSSGYVNASNATGQPLFAHHMPPQFLHQPSHPGMPYLPPGSIRHPGVQHPMFIQQHHQSPMIVPVNQMVPQPFPENAFYYGSTMPMIQSPPQIPSPSLQQSHFNFPSPAIHQPVNPVRPVNQTPVMSQQPSGPMFLVRPSTEIQPTQIIPNRPPQNQSFQGS